MQWLAFIIIGLGIGILAGLSVSPVLSIILTSLMAAAATLAAVLGGYQKDAKDRKVNALPLAVLVMFILLGAGCGMYGRINWSRSLGADIRAEALYPPSEHHLSKIVQEWTGLGLDEDAVKNKIFEIYMAGAAEVLEQQAKQSAPATLATAFSSSVEVDDCTKMDNALDSELQNAMKRVRVDEIQEIAERVDDPEILRLMVKMVCHEAQN